MARLSAAAPNPPARVWTARRGCAYGAAAPCKGCNNGVGVKTRFHVSIFLGRGTRQESKSRSESLLHGSQQGLRVLRARHGDLLIEDEKRHPRHAHLACLGVLLSH